MLNHDHMGTEHLLLGLIHDREDLAVHVLEALRIDPDDVRRRIDPTAPRGRPAPGPRIPYTQAATRALELAGREAARLGHDHIGTEDLLLGLLGEGEGLAAQVLVTLGADLDRARREVRILAGLTEATTPPAETALERTLATVRQRKQAAIDSEAYEVAAGLRDEENRLLEAIERRDADATQSTVDPSPTRKVFVSYRREETSHIAGRVADWLASHLDGFEVFVDVDSIDAGVDFREVIAAEVGKCDVLLAVMGEAWATAVTPAGQRRLAMADDLVRVEVESALSRGIRVIPVLVEDADMPDARELPAELAGLVRRNALRIRHESFRQDVLRLIAALERV